MQWIINTTLLYSNTRIDKKNLLYSKLKQNRHKQQGPKSHFKKNQRQTAGKLWQQRRSWTKGLQRRGSSLRLTDQLDDRAKGEGQDKKQQDTRPPSLPHTWKCIRVTNATSNLKIKQRQHWDAWAQVQTLHRGPPLLSLSRVSPKCLNQSPLI